MADEQPDPAKKDTGKKARPRRDRNQPTPKPEKRGLGALVIKALLAGATAIVVLWMGLYSVEVGKGPWGWSGEEWGGFVTFSRKQVDEARTQVEQIDWAAIGDKITEKTRALWDDAPEWEKKLEAKLAELRGGKPQPPTTPGAAPQAEPGEPRPVTQPGETAATPVTTEPAAKSAPPPPAPPTNLEQGLEALRVGVQHYRRSMTSQAEVKKAKAKFREAQGHLTAAMEDADRRQDEKAQLEIDDYLRQANTYYEDCNKREHIGR